jgi:hypothetical protein
MDRLSIIRICAVAATGDGTAEVAWKRAKKVAFQHALHLPAGCAARVLCNALCPHRPLHLGSGQERLRQCQCAGYPVSWTMVRDAARPLATSPGEQRRALSELQSQNHLAINCQAYLPASCTQEAGEFPRA